MTSRKYGVVLERTTPLRLEVHPGAPSDESWKQWARSQSGLLAVDLFCGAGGLSLGLEEAGFSVILSADTDPWSLETHRHNFPGLALDVDLADPDRRKAIASLLSDLDVALIAGGPPCQPFSRAGRSKIRDLVRAGLREPDDERRHLWAGFLDVIDKVRPRAVLMENVPDMALGDDMAVVRVMQRELEEWGYEVDARLVDAWLHGVPQHRQRLIMIGVREGAFEWPNVEDRPTLWDAIGDLPTLGAGTGSAEMSYDGVPTAPFQEAARQNCRGDAAGVLWDHVTRPVRADDREAFELMKPGTLYSDLPKRLRRYRDDIFDDKYKRLGWDELCRSITAHIAKDGYWYIHPSEPRTLTVREAARIQTFPDQFRFAGARSHQFAQIGNAVPPSLARAMGGAIHTALGRRAPSAASRASTMLSRIRVSLDRWSAQNRTDHPWRYTDDPWGAAVGAVLEGRRGSGFPDAAWLLARCPKIDDTAAGERLRLVTVLAEPTRRRRAVERLAATADAVRADPDGWEGDQWRAAAPLTSAERSWIDTLSLDPMHLSVSTATLRVVARVTGTAVDEQRRLSDGRMMLARIVGTGNVAATRNAALHWLGTTLCVAGDAPACGECPLERECATSSGV